MRVPLMDLVRQYRSIRREVSPALQLVVESQQFILGPAVARFEEHLRRYFGVPGAVGVASGSEALVASLMALEIGPGDEVITTPHTFYATASAIERVGATPVFCDIEPATMNLDPAQVAKAVTRRTRAVVPVHLYGHPAAMGRILAIARRSKLEVVEDCAQAIGATWRARKVGTIGRVGCFSAYPAKNLGAFGDAGFVVTRDAKVADRLKAVRNNGCWTKYLHEIPGYNARLDSIQAAVLDVKLRHIDRWNAARVKWAARYNRAFADLDLTLPVTERFAAHVFHLYIVRSRRRDALAAFLGERGVDTQLYYPVPLHLQKSFKRLGYGRGDFPEAERAAAENLALPLFPEMTRREQDHVIRAVRAFFARSSVSLSTLSVRVR